MIFAQRNLGNAARGVLTLLLALPALASGVDFSAETMQQGAKGEPEVGNMYVSGERMRMESEREGRRMVQIVDHQRGLQWVLMPGEQTYMELRLPPEAAKGRPDANTSPCANAQGVTCRKVGEEAVGGRQAIKWEMTGNNDGKPATVSYWIDIERGIPVRQEMPGRRLIERRLVAQETVNGRAVEKWEMVAKDPSRPEFKQVEWYDPELELAVREQFPDGRIRELRNIRVGSQPEELFQVPAGFTRVEPPSAPTRGGGEPAQR